MSSVPAMSEAAVLACFDEFLELAPAVREQRLQAMAIENPPLHARLQRMLAAATSTTGPLAHPIVDVMRQMRAVLTPPGPHEHLQGYRLLRALGRGGMASVWLAERGDGLLRRQVALKLPGFALRSAVDIARFEHERDVLADLAHPRVARLLEADVTPSGQPFIVMEFVDGVPITTYCDAQRLAIPQRLELFLQVLAAVTHGHQHLVVHGDLKPSNILVAGERQLKLVDFGIAKLLAAGAGTSMPQAPQGTAASTPLYSAPEQVAQLPVSTLTDVYVLGLVLHELLTGVAPQRGATDASSSQEPILQTQSTRSHCPPSKVALTDSAARARQLPSAAALGRTLSGDLDVIVRKAVRQSPELRYGSTQQFANDLRCFLQRRPITARPAHWRHVAGLFLRRHRVASIGVACGALISMITVGAALHQHLASYHCTARDTDCARLQAQANASLSRIRATQGRTAASLTAMRRSVDDTIRGFGAAHEETAMALLSFAILAHDQGQLRTASSALQRASAIADIQVLRAQDHHRLLQAKAVIEIDLGYYEAAREQLERLLAAAWQPAQRPTLLRLQASVALEQGNLDVATAAAREAASLADAQHRTTELLYATQILARIHALQGQTDLALTEIRTVLDGLMQLRMPADSSAVCQAQRVRAEILIRGGDLAHASVELQALAARLQRMPAAAEVELGQVLDLWGSALRGLGRAAESVAVHDAARSHLQQQLSGDHPFLQRNSLYRQAAAGNWDGFESRAQQLGKAFAPGSIWKTILDAHAGSLECRASTSSSCLIVL